MLLGHVIFGKEKKRQFGLFFLKKIKTCEEELGIRLLVFGDLSQVRLFVGTPVRVQFAPPLSQGLNQGLDLVFRLQVNRERLVQGAALQMWCEGRVFVVRGRRNDVQTSG